MHSISCSVVMKTMIRIQLVLVRFLIIFMSLSGFCYQGWTISKDYFSYPTTTFVELEKYRNVTTVPQVGFRVFQEMNYSVPFGEQLRWINNSTRVTLYEVSKLGKLFDTQFRTDSFHKLDYYYMTVSPSTTIELSPEDLYFYPQAFLR